MSLIESSQSFSGKMIKNIIYIYKDDGVSRESLLQIILTLKQYCKKSYVIKTINANAIKNAQWLKNAILFIMPGGADLLYAKKLNGAGNAKIKQYVKRGGSYLGICAGSYYASSYVEFDKQGDLAVLGDRELKFFDGKVIGPILASYSYDTQSGSRAAKISTAFPDLSETFVFYNGGGYFENAESHSNIQIIASYQNKLPAIIYIKYGKGQVILSGVHFEYNADLLNYKDQYLQNVIPDLIKSTTSRNKLIIEIFKILNITCPTA